MTLADLVRGTPFGVDSFETPILGVVALGIAALALLGALRASPPAVAWPALGEAEVAGATRREWIRPLGFVLRLGAMAALAAVLAGPVRVFRGAPEPGLGLDLVLVLDASGSMRAVDAEAGGTFRPRLELAREAVARFAERRAAAGDRVGLVVFGETAFTQCPLTSDGALVGAALGRVEAGIAGEATALGDALALAVKRVAAGTPAPGDAAPGRPLAGRVVVLLTDGRSNAGDVPPDVATGLARMLGVRVHAVGIGSDGPVAMAHRRGDAAGGVRFERHDLDRETLEGVARGTGGRFFHARRAADLEAVYAEIDALERVERRPPPRTRRAARPEPALAVAGGCLALELALARALRRRVA